MTELEKYVHDRCVEEGDCWIWQMCVNRGRPQMGLTNRKTVAVRRHLWQNLKGEPPSGKWVSMTCDTVNCVCPKHLTLTTNKAAQKRAAAQGKFSTLTRRAKLAKSKQAAESPLNEEKVAAIRASDERLKDLAARYGVSMNTISNIRNGKRWKTYSTPFAGLFAMNDSTNRRAA
jgi:hypothetical protein